MVHNINLKQIMRFWNQRYTSSTYTYLCSKWIKYSWKLANNNSILVLLPSSTKCMYTHQFREFFWSIERVKKQASFYGFMTSFGSLNSIHYYSIISKCNKTYSRTTAIIFQRVVKRETLYLVVLAIVQMLHPLQKSWCCRKIGTTNNCRFLTIFSNG